jgi:hypothetical protein
MTATRKKPQAAYAIEEGRVHLTIERPHGRGGPAARVIVVTPEELDGCRLTLWLTTCRRGQA